ncbi:hypothetical protein EAO69_44700 [Streptomyces sp. me109]|nr:hypothetical protein EAO69_44700 [Streptomyces sp. me109]
MSTEVSRKIVTRRPETGWAEARRRHGSGVRTCVPATATASVARRDQADSPEGNIVRGED